MAAMVAGRVALGLGVAPKVWPRCTGAVEGLTLLSCAGIAAVRAALGCGARTMAGFGASFTTGSANFASIWMGFGSGLGFGISILRASNSILGGCGGGGSLGGGVTLTFGGSGGGFMGTTSSVNSYLCCSITCF